MTTANLATPLYYRESGGFSAGKYVLGLILGAVVAAALGAGYAYADLYNPCVSVVTFVITIGFGWVVGVVAGRLLRWAEVRNRGLRVIGAGIVALVAFYASWIFWLYAFLKRYDAEDVQDLSPLQLVTRPAGAWRVIQSINEHGAWTIGSSHGGSSSSPVTGIMLWLCWLAEAAMIIGACVIAANSVGAAFPYCEACSKWAKKNKQLFTAKLMNLSDLRSQLESKNFAPLIANAPAQAADASWLEVWTHSCEQCQDFNTLTIKQTTTSVDKKGKLQKTSNVKISNLLLSTIDLRAMEAMREQQKNPPVTLPPIADTPDEEEYEEVDDDGEPLPPKQT